MMERSDLCAEHSGCCQTPCANKNLTGLLQWIAKGIFGNVNGYFLLTKDINNWLKTLFIWVKILTYQRLGVYWIGKWCDLITKPKHMVCIRFIWFVLCVPPWNVRGRYTDSGNGVPTKNSMLVAQMLKRF